jgi:hypothetical protein
VSPAVDHIDRDHLADRSSVDLTPREDALRALEVLAALPGRQRKLAALQAAGFTYEEIATLSRVADVASVEAAVVSLDDMSSTRVRRRLSLRVREQEHLVDGVALAPRRGAGASGAPTALVLVRAGKSPERKLGLGRVASGDLGTGAFLGNVYGQAGLDDGL